jgi:hypothetical protein
MAIMNPSDITSKLRELELQVIDLKAKTERRINQVYEEIPNQLDREIKRLEARGAESQK